MSCACKKTCAAECSWGTGGQPAKPLHTHLPQAALRLTNNMCAVAVCCAPVYYTHNKLTHCRMLTRPSTTATPPSSLCPQVSAAAGDTVRGVLVGGVLNIEQLQRSRVLTDNMPVCLCVVKRVAAHLAICRQHKPGANRHQGPHLQPHTTAGTPNILGCLMRRLLRLSGRLPIMPLPR